MSQYVVEEAVLVSRFKHSRRDFGLLLLLLQVDEAPPAPRIFCRPEVWRYAAPPPVSDILHLCVSLLQLLQNSDELLL